MKRNLTQKMCNILGIKANDANRDVIYCRNNFYFSGVCTLSDDTALFQYLLNRTVYIEYRYFIDERFIFTAAVMVFGQFLWDADFYLS